VRDLEDVQALELQEEAMKPRDLDQELSGVGRFGATLLEGAADVDMGELFDDDEAFDMDIAAQDYGELSAELARERNIDDDEDVEEQASSALAGANELMSDEAANAAVRNRTTSRAVSSRYGAKSNVKMSALGAVAVAPSDSDAAPSSRSSGGGKADKRAGG